MKPCLCYWKSFSQTSIVCYCCSFPLLETDVSDSRRTWTSWSNSPGHTGVRQERAVPDYEAPKQPCMGQAYLLTVMLKTFSSQLTTPEVLQHIINLIQPCIREEAEGTASGSKRISRLVETEQQLYSEPPERKSQDRLSFMKETNLQNKNWVFHTAYQHQWRVLPRACVLSYMEVSWLHSKLPLPQELYERFPRSTIPWGLERKLQEFFII